ncbi:MAG: hypothetical protein C4K60_04545 [Ideonella sp. MAG2]|nr:MAG: hypothetical protein C4K60_04545 [Ideonella sp. MAG2]
MNRIARGLLTLAALLPMVGCVSVQMPAATANPVALEKLRATPVQSSNVGRFALAPGKPKEMDTSLSGLRGSTLAPTGGSFAGQLKNQLVADLSAAGLYDPNSSILIEGQLTDSMVDAAIGTGTARLAADFQVNRAGKKVYSKSLKVDDAWPSSFVGATALPEAINRYSALYKALVVKLLEDADFRAAIAK